MSFLAICSIIDFNIFSDRGVQICKCFLNVNVVLSRYGSTVPYQSIYRIIRYCSSPSTYRYSILRLFLFLGSDHRTILISMSLSSPGLLSAFWDPRANRVTPLPPPVRAARRRSRLVVLSRLVKQLIGGMRSWVRAAGALFRIDRIKQKTKRLR